MANRNVIVCVSFHSLRLWSNDICLESQLLICCVSFSKFEEKQKVFALI